MRQWRTRLTPWTRGLDVFYLSFCLHRDLHIVAIGPMHDAYPLDLLERKGLYMLIGVVNQPQSPNATAIGEADMASTLVQLPTCLLVLNRAIVMLEPGIALLAWLVVL